MDKIFVIADERCGGSQLGNIFELLSYTRVDDPQNHPTNDKSIYNKKNLISNFSYFERYNYMKVCMASFSVREYKKLLSEVNDGSWKFVFLWRKNFLERAMSKAIAEATGTWHQSQENDKYNSEFKVSTWAISREIKNNKKKLSSIKNYLSESDISFYDLEFSDLYGSHLDTDQRFDYLKQALTSISPRLLDVMTIENAESIKSMLSPRQRLNTNDTYSRITNINEIIEKFSGVENGIISI